MQKNPTTSDLDKIHAALTKAGFKVEIKKELILIECPRYTCTCYFSDEFGWRLTQYNDQVSRILDEALQS